MTAKLSLRMLLFLLLLFHNALLFMGFSTTLQQIFYQGNK